MCGMPPAARLPDDAEDMVRMQGARGRAGLTEAVRNRLATRHDDTTLGAGSGPEQEIVRLLTRPFSRKEQIPEYYRYTSLHVYDWFLAHYPDDPIAAGIVAIQATVADLTAREAARAEQPGEAAPYLPERLDRLRQLVARLDEVVVDPVGPLRGADLRERAKNDATLRWRLFVLTRCTAFPQSADANEHIFLRSVHSCELGFYLVRWAACRAITAIMAGDHPTAAFRIEQVGACSELLNAVFHTLKTLSPEQFMAFREATGAASAVQSLNFHLAELALFGYDPRKFEVFSRFGHLRMLNDPPYRDHRPLRAAVADSASPELTTAFDAVERSLLNWRGRHYGFGRLYLPRQLKGSGGTEGAGYLKTFVNKDSCLPGEPGPVHEAMLRFAAR
ncbi:tryptophan 2,3-dioxygenase family protein [Embleya sp. AB8]|uniref:tryptophan 2,3-dioxygenase family protein n=1 Tax=Embleya sp. AB8 TaxID=3156304 RepID=UPI003C786C9B